MRFLHVADLHLGLRVTRFGAHVNGRVQEARMAALDHLLMQAPALRLDFALVAGDLFDDNRVDLATSRRAFELFAAAKLPIYIISGNHDPLSADSVFARSPWKNGTSRNVMVLREAEPTALPGGMLYPCRRHGPVAPPVSARRSAPLRWRSPPRARPE